MQISKVLPNGARTTDGGVLPQVRLFQKESERIHPGQPARWQSLWVESQVSYSSSIAWDQTAFEY